MKAKRLHWFPRLLLLNATALILATGCATQPGRSFNDDFGQKFPVAPKYVISDKNDTHFIINVNQGSPLRGPERVHYMKQATSAIAEAEAKRRGWASWDVNYIQQRDQGWMLVLIAEVTRKNPVEFTPANH